jgi:hypothetical protein
MKGKLSPFNFVEQIQKKTPWHKVCMGNFEMSNKRKNPSRKNTNCTKKKLVRGERVARVKIRINFGDERAWGEIVDAERGIFRCLNDTFSNVLLKVKKGHGQYKRNGQPCGMRWGHLFEGYYDAHGDVIPTFIIGLDLTPLPFN